MRLRRARLGRIAFATNSIWRRDAACTMRRIRTPGTFGVDDRHNQPFVRFVNANQAFTRKPLTREPAEDSHLKLLDSVPRQNV